MSIFICFHVVFICFSCSGPLLPSVPGGSCQGGSWSQGVQGLRGKWRQMGGEAPVENGGNAGKTSVEITTFPHKLWEILEKTYSAVGNPTFSPSFCLLLRPQDWDDSEVTRIFWCGFFNMLNPPNPSIGWCSGCPRSRKFRIIHHFWLYTPKFHTLYERISWPCWETASILNMLSLM